MFRSKNKIASDRMGLRLVKPMPRRVTVAGQRLREPLTEITYAKQINQQFKKRIRVSSLDWKIFGFVPGFDEIDTSIYGLILVSFSDDPGPS